MYTLLSNSYSLVGTKVSECIRVQKVTLKFSFKKSVTSGLLLLYRKAIKKHGLPKLPCLSSIVIIIHFALFLAVLESSHQWINSTMKVS